MQICSFLKIWNCSFVFVAILDFTESQDYEIVYEECEILRFSKIHYCDALFFFLKKSKTKYIGWQYGSLPRSCFSVGGLVFRPAPRRNTSSSKHARACVGGYLASNKAKD